MYYPPYFKPILLLRHSYDKCTHIVFMPSGYVFAGLTLAYLLIHPELISVQQAYRRQKHIPDGVMKNNLIT